MHVAEKPVSPGFTWCSAFAHKGGKGESQLFPRNTVRLALRSGYRELIAGHCRLLGGGVGCCFWVLSNISFLEIQAWSSVLWQGSVPRLSHPVCWVVELVKHCHGFSLFIL